MHLFIEAIGAIPAEVAGALDADGITGVFHFSSGLAVGLSQAGLPVAGVIYLQLDRKCQLLFSQCPLLLGCKWLRNSFLAGAF